MGEETEVKRGGRRMGVRAGAFLRAYPVRQEKGLLVGLGRVLKVGEAKKTISRSVVRSRAISEPLEAETKSRERNAAFGC